tara:strand:- start:7113 stop:8498 length:1386 start_codon:yes stop_codon:yes gene_type:complete
MIGILSLVAIILLVGTLITFIGSFLVVEQRIEKQGTPYEKHVGTPLAIARLLTKKLSLILLLGTVSMFAIQDSLYYAERGTYYEIIYPNGTKAAEFEEGYHLVVPFTRVNAWTANIDVKAGNLETMSDEVEGKLGKIPVTFVDQVGADVSATYRFTLPRDEVKFLELCVKYRSIENLAQNTLVPTVEEQAKLTSKMYSVQDYISGSAQEFRQTFDEQLKGGTFVVERITNRDTSYVSNDIQKNKDRQIRDISISYSVDKVIDPNTKLPKRIQNEISASGIIVSQVIINSVDIDPAYKQRLVAQKKESAKRQLEQQKIETAKVSQLRIKAEGERDKTSEAAKQEIAQVKTLISIETKLKQEATNLKLAKIQLETARTNARKKVVAAKATSTQNRLLVSAGLTPQEKAEFALKEKIGIANATAKMATPDVVIITNGAGSGNNSSNLTNALIQAEMAKKLINKK